MAWTEGDLVRKLRLIYGCNLEDLAALSGVSFTTINKLELGKTKEPKRSTIQKLAQAFGLTPAQFFATIPSQTIAIADDQALLRRLQREAPRRKPKDRHLAAFERDAIKNIKKIARPQR